MLFGIVAAPNDARPSPAQAGTIPVRPEQYPHPAASPGSPDGSGKPAVPAFWEQNGGHISRIENRMFVGGAVENDGRYPNLAQDWLSALQVAWGLEIGYPSAGMLNVLTTKDPSSSYSVLGAAQSLHFSRSAAAIGTLGFGICNGATSSNCWGFYGEGHKAATGSSVYGMEVDAVGHVPTIAPTPLQQGDLVGHQIACGGEYTSIRLYPCSASIQVAANGAKFFTGINVMQGAIEEGRPSIQLPGENGVVFYNKSGRTGGNIRATFNGSGSNSIDFAGDGLKISGEDGSVVASVANESQVSVALVFAGGSPHHPASISVQTQAADADLVLSGKGAGAVVAGGAIRLAPVRFATLGQCNSTNRGTVAFVTDSVRPVTQWHQKIAEGGGHHPAFVGCDGRDWLAFD